MTKPTVKVWRDFCRSKVSMAQNALGWLNNLLPVTLGNTGAGSCFMALPSTLSMGAWASPSLPQHDQAHCASLERFLQVRSQPAQTSSHFDQVPCKDVVNTPIEVN